MLKCHAGLVGPVGPSGLGVTAVTLLSPTGDTLPIGNKPKNEADSAIADSYLPEPKDEAGSTLVESDLPAPKDEAQPRQLSGPERPALPSAAIGVRIGRVNIKRGRAANTADPMAPKGLVSMQGQIYLGHRPVSIPLLSRPQRREPKWHVQVLGLCRR